MKESNTHVYNAENNLLLIQIWLKTKGQYMKKSNTFVCNVTIKHVCMYVFISFHYKFYDNFSRKWKIVLYYSIDMKGVVTTSRWMLMSSIQLECSWLSTSKVLSWIFLKILDFLDLLVTYCSPLLPSTWSCPWWALILGGLCPVWSPFLLPVLSP